MPRSPEISYDDFPYAPESKEKETSGSLSPFTYLCGVLILALLGLIVLYSSSYSLALDEGYAHYHYFLRQGAGALIGLGLGFLTRFIPRSAMRLGGMLLVPIAAAALILSSIPGFGEDGYALVNGIAVVSAPLLGFLAITAVMSSIFPSEGEGRGRLALSVLLAALLLVLSFISGGISWYVLSSILFLLLLRIRKTGWIPLLLALLFMAVTLIALVAAFPSYLVPVASSVMPVSDPSLYDPSLLAARNAIVSGGIAGDGLGNGLGKLGALTEPHRAFILASMMEELGAAGAAVLLLLLLLISIIGVRTASRANARKDGAAAAASIGLTLFIVLRSLVSICYVSSVLPLPGILLPFFSYDPSGEFLSVFSAVLLYRLIYAMGRPR